MWGKFADRRSSYNILTRHFVGYEYFVTDASDPWAEAVLHLRYGQPWSSSDSSQVFGRVLTRIDVDEDSELGQHLVTATYTIPRLGTNPTLGYLYPTWMSWSDAPLIDKTGTPKKLMTPFLDGADYYRWRVRSGPATRQNIIPGCFFDVEVSSADLPGGFSGPLTSFDAGFTAMSTTTAISAIDAVVGKVNSNDASTKISGGTAGKLWCFQAQSSPLAYGRARVRLHFAKVPDVWGTTWDAAVTVEKEKRTVIKGSVLWVPTGDTETRQWFNTADFSTVMGWIR